jgi:hypothetical protein
MSELHQMIDELIRLNAADNGPFPYEGCRKLLAADDEGVYRALIPDLDSYFSEIAGYRSSAKRMPRWPRDKVLGARSRVERSLQDRYPQYEKLNELRRQDAPDLYERLAQSERARTTLLRFLDLLLESNMGV